jgi:hypothetical protein
VHPTARLPPSHTKPPGSEGLGQVAHGNSAHGSPLGVELHPIPPESIHPASPQTCAVAVLQMSPQTG